MKPILRVSRYLLVVTVVGCIVMFGVVTIYAALCVGSVTLQIHVGGYALTDIAAVTVAAFKILDLFLLGTILYIVALGLAALFLDAETALPPWFKVGELQDLKVIVSSRLSSSCSSPFSATCSNGRTGQTSPSSAVASPR